MKNKIIAVDFDGTLFENKYPYIGKPNIKLINKLIKRQNKGDKIILWTCREGQELTNAINACKMFGLEFNAINDNVSEIIEAWGENTRKIFANIYIDDLNKSVTLWEE
jgi:hydroxymethylpyrimidine pyrophosphatase-like HAD family hydrolase